MTQHITITGVDDTAANPHVARVWRDDQVIMWGLAEGLRWANPDEAPPPLQFLPKDDTHDDWPGTPPMPVGEPPAEGEPDRRFYVAMANHLMESGSETARYHYRFHVVVIKTNKHRLIDPDVENHPEP